MVFQWSLSDSKSSQVSRTFLSILTDLNNVVRMVSTRPLIYNSSVPYTNPLDQLQSFGYCDKSISYNWYKRYFHVPQFVCFFNYVARSTYLSFFSFSFNFILWSAGTAKSAILQSLSFLLLLLLLVLIDILLLHSLIM